MDEGWASNFEVQSLCGGPVGLYSLRRAFSKGGLVCRNLLKFIENFRLEINWKLKSKATVDRPRSSLQKFFTENFLVQTRLVCLPLHSRVAQLELFKKFGTLNGNISNHHYLDISTGTSSVQSLTFSNYESNYEESFNGSIWKCVKSTFCMPI